MIPPTRASDFATGTPAPAPQSPNLKDFQEQLNALKDQVQQLQMDKTTLEAKLKEAFSARPSGTDPRELAKAQDQARNLQKENDLLKVTIEQEKSKPSAVDPKVLAQTQAALAEANRKLTEQTEKAKTLAEEKQYLQNKLSVLSPTEQNATALAQTKEALADAKRQLAEQREISAKLALEREALQSRFRTMSADGSATAALRAENQLLKKQLAEYKAGPAGQSGSMAIQLAQAQAEIAVLRSDKENLRLEKLALENRVKQLSSAALASTTPSSAAGKAAASKAEDVARIKQLEKERDDLQKKLEAAAKELYGKKGQAVAARVEEMENQLGVLRARLAVFEARAVPYSPEELALFKAPEPHMPDPRAGKKPLREIPSSAQQFVAEAQKNFRRLGQRGKIEERYQAARAVPGARAEDCPHRRVLKHRGQFVSAVTVAAGEKAVAVKSMRPHPHREPQPL